MSIKTNEINIMSRKETDLIESKNRHLMEKIIKNWLKLQKIIKEEMTLEDIIFKELKDYEKSYIDNGIILKKRIEGSNPNTKRTKKDSLFNLDSNSSIILLYFSISS